jgi:hypothetical protein
MGNLLLQVLPFYAGDKDYWVISAWCGKPLEKSMSSTFTSNIKENVKTY